MNYFTHSAAKKINLQNIFSGMMLAVCLAPVFPSALLGQIYEGSFVGDGTASRTISIPGVTPSFVMVKNGVVSPGTGQHTPVRTSAMGANASSALAANPTYTDAILSMASGGFTVGSNVVANANGVTMYWVAIQNVAGQLITGSYVGNGTDSRDITGLGFTPDWVLVINPGSSVGSVWRTSAMVGDATVNWTTVGLTANLIQALGAGSFQVGTDGTVNTAGVTYYYVAGKSQANQLAVGSYVGDGVDNRSITGVGFSPDVFIIKRNSGVSGVFKTTSTGAATDISLIPNATAANTNFIKTLGADGITVGTATRVNTAAAEYYWLALNGTAVPLPVEWGDISAQQEGAQVVVNWTTASELNSHHFTLQRSADGETFTDISTVPSHGNSDVPRAYTAYDNAPVAGRTIYRLVETGVNGAASYSEMREVVFNPLSINVFSSGSGEVSIEGGSDGDSFSLYTAEGRLVTKVTLSGSASEKITVPAPGVYFWQIGSRSRSFSGKVVLEAR